MTPINGTGTKQDGVWEPDRGDVACDPGLQALCKARHTDTLARMLSAGMRTCARVKCLERTAVLACAVMLSAPSTARAQSSPQASVPAPMSDRDMARSIALQAFSAFDARRYESAVERFTKAIALYDAPTLRLGRGHAHAALRKLVLAAADYRSAATHPAAPEEPASFARARRQASLKYGAIQARLPRITLAVGDLVPLVTLDGEVVELEKLNTSVLLDPGPHEIVFHYHGQRTVESIVLEEGANEFIRFEATALPAPRTSHPVVTEAGPSDAPVVPTVITGALLAGTVVVAIVGLNAWDKFERLDASEAPKTERDAQRSKAITWTWLTSGLGAAAVGSAGVTIYLWVQSASARPTAAPALARRNAPTGTVFGLAGTF